MELFLTGFFSSLFTGIGQRIDPEVNRIEGRKFNRGRGGERRKGGKTKLPCRLYTKPEEFIAFNLYRNVLQGTGEEKPV